MDTGPRMALLPQTPEFLPQRRRSRVRITLLALSLLLNFDHWKLPKFAQ